MVVSEDEYESTIRYAGIYIPDGGEIIIQGTGSGAIYAYGRGDGNGTGAGIGGNGITKASADTDDLIASAGKLTVNSSNIYAYGGGKVSGDL